MEYSERLDFYGDNVSNDTVQKLLIDIKTRNYKTIRLHRVQSLGDNDCTLLYDILTSNNHLQTLVVSETSITGVGAKIILNGVMLSKSLKHLKLDVDHPVNDLALSLKQLISYGFTFAEADGKDFGKALFIIVVRKPTSLVSAELSLFSL